MKKEKYLMSVILSVSLGIFFSGAHFYKKDVARHVESQAAAYSEVMIRPYSPSLGSEDAPVTIVEFFDPQCEACREFHSVLKDLLREFDGKVRLVVRYKMFHENSSYAASVLEAAREQGKYWESLDELFAKQPEWGSHDNPKPELILGYMKNLGLELQKLETAMENAEIRDRLEQDEKDSAQLNVTVTPTLFVNGKPLREEDYENYETVRNAVKAHLESAR